MPARLPAILAAHLVAAPAAAGAEHVRAEAEHPDGLRGYCWPVGTPVLKKTAGHRGPSGPGWVAAGNRGGPAVAAGSPTRRPTRRRGSVAGRSPAAGRRPRRRMAR
jgi:hypothetical protein